MTNYNITHDSVHIQNEPSIAVNPLSNRPNYPDQQTIIAISNGFVNGGSQTGNCVIGVYRSGDGKNFNLNAIYPPKGYDHISDPTIDSGFNPLKFNPDKFNPDYNFNPDYTGFFLIAGVASQKDPDLGGLSRGGTIFVYPDTDDGINFDPFIEPIPVNQGYGWEINDDKPFVAIDKSGGSPYLTNAYITYTRLYNSDNGSLILFQRSEDLGQTWSQPIRLSEPFNPVSPAIYSNLNSTILFTNNNISYDTTNPALHRGSYVTITALDSGENFRIANNITSGTDTFKVGTTYNRNGLNFKIDRTIGVQKGDLLQFPVDSEFGTVSTHYPKNQVWGSSIAVGPEGQVYVAWIETDEIPDNTEFNSTFPPNTQTATFKIRRSDDGGITFQPIVNVFSFPMVQNPFDPKENNPNGWDLVLLTQANISVDTSTGHYKGRVYAVWHQAHLHPDFGFVPAVVMMSYSDDKGKTWSYPTPTSLSDDSPFHVSFSPSISVCRNTGKVGIAFYSNEFSLSKGGDIKLIDVMVSQDKGGGISLTTSRLTSSSLDLRINPFPGKRDKNRNWIGDYIGTSFIPSGDLVAVWTDLQGTNDLDIFIND